MKNASTTRKVTLFWHVATLTVSLAIVGSAPAIARADPGGRVVIGNAANTNVGQPTRVNPTLPAHAPVLNGNES